MQERAGTADILKMIGLTCTLFSYIVSPLIAESRMCGSGGPEFLGRIVLLKAKGMLFGPSPSANLAGVEG